ncbi:MAG TPA: metal-dependent hydrolase [Thermomicrobiales bacterium]|nr:metal-dependent hydrolase [Thermomicrobiales bacterium]
MSLTITWYGHSAFGLEADGTTVLIDPYISGNPAAKTKASSLAANTILLTHAHNDHVGDTVAIAKRTGATVIATFELANYVESQGVRSVIGGNHGGTIRFDGGSTKFTPAWHTSSYADGEDIVAPGLPAGHVVRFGGKTIYFAGDTSLFLDMQLIAEEELDVAVLPIGDHFTMGPADAVKAAKMLRAGTIIPCHYNTFAPIKQDPQQFKRDVEAATASTVVVLEPGASATL